MCCEYLRILCVYTYVYIFFFQIGGRFGTDQSGNTAGVDTVVHSIVLSCEESLFIAHVSDYYLRFSPSPQS